jgi:hypothetical protein
MKLDSTVSAKLGGEAKINAMTPEEVQKAFIASYPQGSWADMIAKLTKQSQGGA